MNNNTNWTGLSPCSPGLIQNIEILITLQGGLLLTIPFESHGKSAAQKDASRLLAIGELCQSDGRPFTIQPA